MLIQIAGERVVGFDDRGHGQTVVMLHGIMSDRTVFDALASKLASDYRVITVDLRGHGQSSDGPDYELHSLSEDVLALITARGLGSASLVGWSMGGTVAMDIALRRPDVVDRLVLVGATPCLIGRPDWGSGFPHEAAAALARQLKEDWTAGAESFAASVLGAAPEDLRADYLRMAHAARPDVTLTCFQTIGGLDMRPRLHSLAMPVATIVGSDDHVCPVAASDYLATTLSGTRFVIDGAAHAPFLTAPVRFESDLRLSLAL